MSGLLQKLIVSISLYNQWNEQNCSDWLTLRDVSIVRFYFRTNIHVWALCIFLGLQLSTWLELSYSDLAGVSAIVTHALIALGLSGLLAILLRYFTDLSYKQAMSNNKLND
jgi:hypothetical protein